MAKQSKQPKQTRMSLKKAFFDGNISHAEFKAALADMLTYRGFHIAPGSTKPEWSGIAHNTRAEADADNLPWLRRGHTVDVYITQRR